jgi:hypothetical protein
MENAKKPDDQMGNPTESASEETPQFSEKNPKNTKATEARSWPVPKGFTDCTDEGEDMIFIGGLPGKPPEK